MTVLIIDCLLIAYRELNLSRNGKKIINNNKEICKQYIYQFGSWLATYSGAKGLLATKNYF